MAVFSGVALLLYLVIFGFSIYLMILFIKLSLRGIRALDIYIENNSNHNRNNNDIDNY